MAFLEYSTDDFPLYFKNNTGEYFAHFSDFPNIFPLLDEQCNLRFVRRQVRAFSEIRMFRYIEARAVSCNTPRYFSEAFYTHSDKQYRSLQSGLKFRWRNSGLIWRALMRPRELHWKLPSRQVGHTFSSRIFLLIKR